ncbi:hypothetical protein E3P92_03949 [Wallemia ichthyophaga]|nr:hypothetical protein E3P92_03949 [Wallemia ichthyophaga]
MSDGNLSALSLSSESSSWREKLNMLKQRREAKPAPVLQFSAPTPSPSQPTSMHTPSPQTPQTPSDTAKDYARIDEASLIESYQKPEHTASASRNSHSSRHKAATSSTFSMRAPITSRECLQRATFLKERAHDYLQESRALLDRASVMAYQEADHSHDKARRREEWAQKARKHAEKLDKIIIKYQFSDPNTAAKAHFHFTLDCDSPYRQQMTVIKSIFSDADIPKISLFDHILPQEQSKNSSVVYVDAQTGRCLTISELRRDALRLAYGLRKYHNIGRGDSVLIVNHNSITYPVLFFAVIATGATASLANPANKHLEMSHQIKDSDISFVFANPDKIELCSIILRERGWSENRVSDRVVSATENSPRSFKSYTQLLCNDLQKGVPETFAGEDAHSVAVTCYSSGTTGVAKGVMTTHYNLVANLTQLDWSRAYSTQKSDVVLAVLPYYHIFGLTSLLLNFLKRENMSVVLPRFSLEAFGAAVEKYRVTLTAVVPPILHSIAKEDVERRHGMSSLKILNVGAAPVSPKLIEQIGEKFNSSVLVSNGYGLTETSPVTHKLPLEYARSHSGYIGRMLSNTTARLVDENGKDVPGDNKSSGELWIKGPQVMRGYLNNPQATAQCMTSDGYFKTGDIAIYDDQTFLFKIVGRLKEMIKYKGIQVAPSSLEAVLLSHPQVNDAAVIGVYDDRQVTELPRAYIVPQDAANFDNQVFCNEIEAWVADIVANYSKLRGGVHTIDVIPKTPSGKIVRRHLHMLAAQQHIGLAKL